MVSVSDLIIHIAYSFFSFTFLFFIHIKDLPLFFKKKSRIKHACVLCATYILAEENLAT